MIFRYIGKAIRTKAYWALFPIMILATAYGDVSMIGKYTFPDYVLLCTVELFMLFLGISIGYYTRVFEQNEGVGKTNNENP